MDFTSACGSLALFTPFQTQAVFVVIVVGHYQQTLRCYSVFGLLFWRFCCCSSWIICCCHCCCRHFFCCCWRICCWLVVRKGCFLAVVIVVVVEEAIVVVVVVFWKDCFPLRLTISTKRHTNERKKISSAMFTQKHKVSTFVFEYSLTHSPKQQSCAEQGYGPSKHLETSK